MLSGPQECLLGEIPSLLTVTDDKGQTADQPRLMLADSGSEAFGVLHPSFGRQVHRITFPYRLTPEQSNLLHPECATSPCTTLLFNDAQLQVLL
jgi:hypothetical protein